MLLWNLAMCLVISVACWSFLLSNHGSDRISIASNAGLLLLAVGMFVSAFAPIVRNDEPGWWSLLARTGGAIVAAVLYEQRFGVRAQLQALIDHFRSCPARWRATLDRLQQVYHLMVRR